MLVSIIIPTLNEESCLSATVARVARHPDVELIIVDGGSSDHTVEIARQFTSYVFVTQPGRAEQMNIGARDATGDILLFLHADSQLLPGALEEIQRRLVCDGALGGAFDLKIDSPRRLCRLVERIASRRSRLLRLPYGDQGVFVWRHVFEALGGFPDITIMEDIAFGWQLRRAGRLAFLPSGLLTSARRWHANGILRTTLVNWAATVLFLIGMSPAWIRRTYDDWLISGKPTRRRGDYTEPRPNRLRR